MFRIVDVALLEDSLESLCADTNMEVNRSSQDGVKKKEKLRNSLLSKAESMHRKVPNFDLAEETKKMGAIGNRQSNQLLPQLSQLSIRKNSNASLTPRGMKLFLKTPVD